MADNDEVLAGTSEPEAPGAPLRPKAPPIESRFLYVDVAAMRAKQLRRGALPRIDEDDLGEHRTMPHKAERIAMEEVKRGLVLYEVPGPLRPPEPQ
jgi:DNA-directed RNA polymerase omega subunit